MVFGREGEARCRNHHCWRADVLDRCNSGAGLNRIDSASMPFGLSNQKWFCITLLEYTYVYLPTDFAF